MNENQVGWKERISYGLSDTACNLVFQVIGTYLMFFYTDVFGLSIAAVGTLFLVARVIDALDAPLFGVLIDRTNTRWGKSRPYFLWLAVPFGVMATLTFFTPDLSYQGKLIYAYITYISVGIIYSGINIPVTSILPSLSSNPQERTVLGTVRSIGGQMGAIIVTVATLPIVSVLGGGDDQKGFFWTMLIFSAFGVVMLLITFKNTKERVILPGKKVTPFKEGIKAIRGNLPWFIMIFLNFIYWMGQTIKNQTTVYYFANNIGNAKLVPIMMSFNFITLFSLVLTPTFSKRIGKRNTMILGLVIGVIGQILISIGGTMENIPLIMAGTIIGTFGTGFILGLISVMLADSVDYGEWKNKVRAAGLLTSASSFGAKFGMGIGGALTAAILSAGGYIANQKQTDSALQAIEFNFIWLPIICSGLAIIALLFHKFDKQEKQIIKDLDERRRLMEKKDGMEIA
ncbi:sodium:solute symporter [Bacillus sp. SA1-12]|uniref:glycoside-pentoside-hexuronide (GPH):cation symporter n=1 Tax=Bacillus sp. SA1-12 TaxID=1455638 RepID=UPI000625E0B2|nr:glycoside-pentoside-hexuronide (GPH):cation symporter [Bacillus sp. SA1-12]KKI93443.1 sodium:solute symporter [Bacillus sp. SA1-12]